MDTKLAKLQTLMANNAWDKALALAAKFPRLGKEKDVIIRAHECRAHPRFYIQLGIDCEAAYQAGIAALKAKYSR